MTASRPSTKTNNFEKTKNKKDKKEVKKFEG